MLMSDLAKSGELKRSVFSRIDDLHAKMLVGDSQPFGRR
jgi:hypothetical protein